MENIFNLKNFLLFCIFSINIGKFFFKQYFLKLTTILVSTATTFQNPLLYGADPWVIQVNKTYYYTQTFGDHIAIFKTNEMSLLGKVTPKTVYNPGAFLQQIWAPEIHFLDGKWYIYFAADDGNNDNHRVYVIENVNSDPTTGNWTFKGKVADPNNDRWAIDADVFTYQGNNYLLCSGWEGNTNVAQNIYIAKLKNPWTLDGE